MYTIPEEALTSIALPEEIGAATDSVVVSDVSM
jgi:hypothetical protein